MWNRKIIKAPKLDRYCSNFRFKENKHQSTYVLGTGVKSQQLLDWQHSIHEKNSYAHLRKAGLSNGQVVWDIGCGSGVMTEYLARSVGERGHVYALDISSDQINVSRERLMKNNLHKRVTFFEKNLEDLTPLTEEADIVYGRFFLMHQENVEKSLNKMTDLLKGGGRLALQESTMDSLFFSKKFAEIDEYVKAIVKLGQINKLNFNLGDSLAAICKQMDRIGDVEDFCTQDTVENKLASFILLGRMDELTPSMTKQGVATYEDIDRWKTETVRVFHEAENDPKFCVKFAKQTYIVAHKNSLTEQKQALS